MEGHCSTGQRPQSAVLPMEEEEEDIVHYSLKVDKSREFNKNNDNVHLNIHSIKPFILL